MNTDTTPTMNPALDETDGYDASDLLADVARLIDNSELPYLEVLGVLEVAKVSTMRAMGAV